ncbi:MAG: hypothetical protein HKL80_07730 [Acidimicrobiales bacterium]|nr:hypothetical protein [Acidimicrobiales bacterium]
MGSRSGHEIDPFYPPFPSTFSNLFWRSSTASLLADEDDFGYVSLTKCEQQLVDQRSERNIKNVFGLKGQMQADEGIGGNILSGNLGPATYLPGIHKSGQIDISGDCGC